MPGEGWDLAGLEHLRLAAAAAERRRPAYGVSSGLAGLAHASWCLSRGGLRYRSLRASADSALVQLLASDAGPLTTGPRHGVEVSTFDVISGLTGVGRYLLIRRDDSSCRGALESILRYLVDLTGEEDGVPHWHTPPQHVSNSAWQHAWPDGNLNCGLAHGIPGPLALLSLAADHGVRVEGHERAIRRISDWLLGARTEDRWGVNWPVAVELGPPQPPAAPASRAAWCYGSPGVARALWLAAGAVGERSYADAAVSAMEAVYRRPLRDRQIDSPTFCHGIAGLQQITLRFAIETRMPLFADEARKLHRQLTDAYEPDSGFGYRNVEPGGNRIDQPGLLDGAAGVALVLLAASTPVEPTWDALFMLS
jgi:hypothetical protein